MPRLALTVDHEKPIVIEHPDGPITIDLADFLASSKADRKPQKKTTLVFDAPRSVAINRAGVRDSKVESGQIRPTHQYTTSCPHYHHAKKCLQAGQVESAVSWMERDLGELDQCEYGDIDPETVALTRSSNFPSDYSDYIVFQYKEGKGP